MSKTDNKLNSEKLIENLISMSKDNYFTIHKMYKPIPVNSRWDIEDGRKNEDFHLLYVLDGKCDYSIKGRQYRLNKGQLTFVSNGCSHSARNGSTNPLSIFSLRVGLYNSNDDSFVSNAFKEPFGFTITPKEHLGYERILDRLYQHYLEQNVTSQYAINTLLHKLLLDMCEEPKSLDISDNIRIITDQIILRHGKDIHVDDLAEQMNISNKQFTILFNRYNSITPHQFIIKTRINHAKYLLDETTLPINIISNELGYTDSFCFSKQFKKVTGVSPSVFRHSINKN